MNFQFPLGPSLGARPISNFQFPKIQTKVRLLELIIHLVIITILVVVTARPVGAQEKINQTTSATTAAEQQATAAAEKSEYVLPYPGILPDHPLYIIKAIRDRIIDILIADPLKKAEFTLLQSEKRVAAAAALIEKGKHELAESTASKGVNYLGRSITLYQKAKEEGKDVSAFAHRFSDSTVKQEEVLLSLASKTSGNVKERFTTLAEEVAKKRVLLQNK